MVMALLFVVFGWTNLSLSAITLGLGSLAGMLNGLGELRGLQCGGQSV